VKLNLDASCVQNDPTLSSKLTLSFLLPITIKGGKSMTMQTQTLLDSRAYACFIGKELIQHNLALLENATPMAVEAIDGQNFFLGPVMHETKALMVTNGSHSNNVILSLTNPIIIGLPWLILYNL
jgi:hypothetical protein